MKKVALIIICLGAFLFGNAQEENKGINFEKGKFSASLAKAKAEDKLIFMDIYASWCPPCIRMAKDVFPLEKVGLYFNKNFVNVKFDAEKGEGIEIAKKYKPTNYPTFLILNSDGEVLGRMIGGDSAEKFIKRIEALRVTAVAKNKTK